MSPEIIALVIGLCVGTIFVISLVLTRTTNETQDQQPDLEEERQTPQRETPSTPTSEETVTKTPSEQSQQPVEEHTQFNGDTSETVTCPNCGAENNPEYDFCDECITPLH